MTPDRHTHEGAPYYPPMVHSVYFSATFSTKRVVNEIANRLGTVVSETDLTLSQPARVLDIHPSDILVVGVPVYGGRVPLMALPGLNMIKGNKTPCILVAVYGNRDYDDALVELSDIVERNGFRPVGAAAIVAEHSIFPKVAAGRPDDLDWTLINNFCAALLPALTTGGCEAEDRKVSTLKGNRPYRKSGPVPIHPSANSLCNSCGKCARECPAGAIHTDHPSHTDKQICIACARCIKVCPQQARSFRGLLYKIAGWKFTRDNSARKEPEFFFL